MQPGKALEYLCHSLFRARIGKDLHHLIGKLVSGRAMHRPIQGQRFPGQVEDLFHDQE
jgi:hypothetical protein